MVLLPKALKEEGKAARKNIMTKRNIGDEIIKGMKEAIAHMHGEKTPVVVHTLEIPSDIKCECHLRKIEVIKASIG